MATIHITDFSNKLYNLINIVYECACVLRDLFSYSFKPSCIVNRVWHIYKDEWLRRY